MVESKLPGAEPQGEADDRPDTLIGRRRLLKMLAAAGGAALAAVVLPEVWNPPVVEAKPPAPRNQNPVLSAPQVGSQGSASWSYSDPMGLLGAGTTLVKYTIGSQEYKFAPLATYGINLSGNGSAGQMFFANARIGIPNCSNPPFAVAIRVGSTSNWWEQKKASYRQSNTLYWTTCNQS
jgi:hypothetical protein